MGFKDICYSFSGCVLILFLSCGRRVLNEAGVEDNGKHFMVIEAMQTNIFTLNTVFCWTNKIAESRDIIIFFENLECYAFLFFICFQLGFLLSEYGFYSL